MFYKNEEKLVTIDQIGVPFKYKTINFNLVTTFNRCSGGSKLYEFVSEGGNIVLHIFATSSNTARAVEYHRESNGAGTIQENVYNLDRIGMVPGPDSNKLYVKQRADKNPDNIIKVGDVIATPRRNSTVLLVTHDSLVVDRNGKTIILGGNDASIMRAHNICYVKDLKD